VSDAGTVHRTAMFIDGTKEARKLATWLWTGGTPLALLVLNAGVGPVAPDQRARLIGVVPNVLHCEDGSGHAWALGQ